MRPLGTLITASQLHASELTVLRCCPLQLLGTPDLKWQPRQRWHTRRTRGITPAPCAAASRSRVRNPTEEEVRILEPWPPDCPTCLLEMSVRRERLSQLMRTQQPWVRKQWRRPVTLKLQGTVPAPSEAGRPSLLPSHAGKEVCSTSSSCVAPRRYDLLESSLLSLCICRRIRDPCIGHGGGGGGSAGRQPKCCHEVCQPAQGTYRRVQPSTNQRKRCALLQPRCLFSMLYSSICLEIRSVPVPRRTTPSAIMLIVCWCNCSSQPEPCSDGSNNGRQFERCREVYQLYQPPERPCR